MLPVFAVGDAPGVAPDDAVPSPANYPEAFSVGAADANDEPLPSSFHGTAACGTSPRAAPRLVAPGADITSAGRGTRLESRTGTDAAAPHAAGAAALLRSAFPDLTVERMDEILQRSAKDFVPGPDPPYRPGRLDAFTAVTFEDARFISRVAPAGTRVTGEVLRSVSVTMRNSGVTTWQRGVHALAPVNPDLPTFGVTRVDLPVAEVPPGAEVVFTFDITMPQVPNLAPGYNFQWQMVHEGVGFFGDPTPSVNVPVRGINEASLVNQNPPPQLMPGECTPVSVAFQNMGTNAWTKAQNPQDNTTWGLNRVDLAPGEVVPPGGVKTFGFTACAPPIQGDYDFQWRMVQDGVEWFGQFSPNVVVTVTGNDNATSCGSSGVPAELRVGQPADVTICLQNTGTNAWIGGYCLVAMQPGFWGPSSVCLGPGEAVVQNQARNFSFRITAPNRPGRWDFGFQLDRGDGHRFGSFATTIAIPLDFQANSCFSSTQGACSWFFRHYDPAGLGWPKMTFAGDHWQGPGPNQQIRANTASPGDQPVARFWKSAFASNVRISGEVHDLDGSCGDGVHFFLRKNKGPRNLIWDTIVNNGDAAPHSFSFEKWVDVNDTIRLIVQKRSTTGCDTTFFDPLIQVLPSDAVGAIPGAQAIIDPLVEPD